MTHRSSGGCGRRVPLLASASVAALLIGGGMPVAFAATCSNTITAGYDNPGGHTTANVCVQNTSFTGNITNEGTISPSGITLQSSTVSGFIGSSGTINGGISLDSPNRVTAGGIAVLITGPLTGGISNAGAISGAGGGIVVTSTARFGSTSAGGGITNSGTISSGGNGVIVKNVSTFAGGISDGGTISAGHVGISVSVGSQFGSTSIAGGVANSGIISAGRCRHPRQRHQYLRGRCQQQRRDQREQREFSRSQAQRHLDLLRQRHQRKYRYDPRKRVRNYRHHDVELHGRDRQWRFYRRGQCWNFSRRPFDFRRRHQQQRRDHRQDRAS